MEINAFCITCNKEYVTTDFNAKCPYCKEYFGKEREREGNHSSILDNLKKILDLVPKLADDAIILKEFIVWLNNYIKEQENQSFQYSYQNEGKDIGNLYAFDSKLETLNEVRDKLNQIKEKVNTTYPKK